MSHPRRIVASETYLITRRCSHRTFRLRPSAETNRIFMYCIAFAAQKTGVLVHAACVMSNHHHLVVTDLRGILPDFLRELHRFTAKAMNASQGEWENLWAAEPCNVVRLVTDDDVTEKIAYVVANPVAAGLVRRPEDWPGLVAWGERVMHVERPQSYFHEGGTCPRILPLMIEPPRARDRELSRDERCKYVDRVAQAMARNVAEAHRAMASAGRQFLGAAGVLGASFIQRAKTYEQRFGVIPSFAAKVRSVRDRLRRVERRFRSRYRAALESWRLGVREVAFPCGTWGLAVYHAAFVEPPDTA